MISSTNLTVLSKTGHYLMPTILGIPCWPNNTKLTICLHLNIHLYMIGLDKFKKSKPKRIKNLPVLKREKLKRSNYNNSTKNKKHK